MGGTGIPGSKPRLKHNILEKQAVSRRRERETRRLLRSREKRLQKKAHIRLALNRILRKLPKAIKQSHLTPTERAQIILAAHQLYGQVTRKLLLTPRQLTRISHEARGGLDVLTPSETQREVEKWKYKLGELEEMLKKPRLLRK